MLNDLPPQTYYPIHAIRFVTPRGQQLDVPFEPKHKQGAFLIIKRYDLDLALLKKAQQAGVTFLKANVVQPALKGGKVVGVEAQVNGKRQTFTAPITIGADGASSVMARHLLPEKPAPKFRFLALRGYAFDFKTIPNLVEFYWTRELKPGYFWIFPTGENQANIGMGMPADRFYKMGQGLKELFFQYLGKPPFALRRGERFELRQLNAWPIPLSGAPHMQRVFNGALLIGDAGYLVDPLSGEGLFNAIKSGMLAADVTIKALKKKDFTRSFLQEFDRAVHRELWPTIRRSIWFVRGMRYFPQLLETYFYLAQRKRWAFRTFFSNLSKDFQFKI